MKLICQTKSDSHEIMYSDINRYELGSLQLCDQSSALRHLNHENGDDDVLNNDNNKKKSTLISMYGINYGFNELPTS